MNSLPVKQEEGGRLPKAATGAGGDVAAPRDLDRRAEEEALGHGGRAERANGRSAEGQAQAGQGEGGAPPGGRRSGRQHGAAVQVKGQSRFK